MTPPNAELLALREQCSRLQRRNAELQSHVDREGERIARSIAGGIYDANSARNALEQYDAAWFDGLLYGDAVRRRIAENLLRAVMEYPFLDANYLRGVTTGDRA